MSRNRKHFNDSDSTTDINISPLIDMVFILLIFFIVTTVFVEEKGMAARTPDPIPDQKPEEDREDALQVIIRYNGQILAKRGSITKDIGVGGVRAAVKQEMQRETRPLTISADSSAKMDLVVRVMDDALLGGAESVSIKTIEQE